VIHAPRQPALRAPSQHGSRPNRPVIRHGGRDDFASVKPQRSVRRRPARGRTVAPPRVCGNVEVLPIGSVRTSILGGPRPLPRHRRAHQPLHPQLRIAGKVRITTAHVLSPSPRRSSCSEVISTATGAGEQAGTRALTSAHNEVESTRHYVGLGHKRFYLSGESVIAESERVRSGRHGRSARDYAPLLSRGCRLRCWRVGSGVGFGVRSMGSHRRCRLSPGRG
jgi:hypothetical protein